MDGWTKKPNPTVAVKNVAFGRYMYAMPNEGVGTKSEPGGVASLGTWYSYFFDVCLDESFDDWVSRSQFFCRERWVLEKLPPRANYDLVVRFRSVAHDRYLCVMNYGALFHQHKGFHVYNKFFGRSSEGPLIF